MSGSMFGVNIDKKKLCNAERYVEEVLLFSTVYQGLSNDDICKAYDNIRVLKKNILKLFG